MGIKLETIKGVPKVMGTNGERDFQEFLKTLKDMKVGQSFLWKLASTDRMALCVAGMLLDRRYITRKEGDEGKHRVWRLE